MFKASSKFQLWSVYQTESVWPLCSKLYYWHSCYSTSEQWCEFFVVASLIFNCSSEAYFMLNIFLLNIRITYNTQWYNGPSSFLFYCLIWMQEVSKPVNTCTARFNSSRCESMSSLSDCTAISLICVMFSVIFFFTFMLMCNILIIILSFFRNFFVLFHFVFLIYFIYIFNTI